MLEDYLFKERVVNIKMVLAVFNFVVAKKFG